VRIFFVEKMGIAAQLPTKKITRTMQSLDDCVHDQSKS
jgi:hypothetical protein